MTLGNFYDILVAIIGQPQNDIEQTILFFLACILGASTILFVYKMFEMVGGFIRQ